MAHTPGPWTVDETPENGRGEMGEIRIFAGSDDIAAAYYYELAEAPAAGANARLIAAAPDLLLALQMMCSVYDAVRPAIGVGARDTAESAIRKARGEC